jgi:osomolarity two-component system, response regulator SSK1
MGDIKGKIRAKFSRRHTAAPSVTSSAGSDRPSSTRHGCQTNASTQGSSDDKTRQPPTSSGEADPTSKIDVGKSPGWEESSLSLHSAGAEDSQASDVPGNDQRPATSKLSSINENTRDPPGDRHSAQTDPAAAASANDDAALPAIGTPTPIAHPGRGKLAASPHITSSTSPPALTPSPAVSRPETAIRRQSLIPNRQTTFIRALLGEGQGDGLDAVGVEQLLPMAAKMATRKIWVRRPGASATLVTINEDDVVDDVRDMILRKYANSLGRQFDSPDLTLRIVPRENRVERILGPEEPMARTLDAYFPGGQTVDEALVIDVPLRRTTPMPSPRTGPPHAPHLTAAILAEEPRPPEGTTDYFGPGAVAGTAVPVMVTAPSTGTSQHAIAVLTTGQVPQLPSPGGTRARQYRERPERPKLGRHHTSSPTAINIVTGAHVPNIAATAAPVGKEP